MSNQTLSLLLVDDEPLILKGLETTFDWQSFGYEVIGTARDGLFALDIIKEKSPDVIITDIYMKNMDGISLIRQCSKEYPGIKFVILSGHQEFSYAKSACELGVFSYLLKPISDIQLKTTMKSLHKECLGNRDTISKIGLSEKRFKSDGCDKSVERLREALDYISKNLSDSNLSMQQVSQELHYNYNYFGRLFKSLIGMSFKDYVNELRLKRATALLMDDDLSIVDISYITGISNQSYFAFLFKNKYGQTPSEYRKNNKNV